MNTAFGLDIGAATTKVVWLSSENGGFVFRSASIGQTPDVGMSSESQLDLEQMARTVKELVTETKISTKNVSMAIPEYRVYTKVIELPVLSEKELASAIYWEAEQHIPVPLSTITIDWKVLSKQQQKEGQRMQVLLVGAPTSLIQKYQQVANMAGLNPVAIETESLSITRIITYMLDKIVDRQASTNVVLHIGATNTIIIIIHEGITVFTYSIAIGGVAFSRAISSDFGFTFEQAEQYKTTYGYDSKDFGGKLASAVEPLIQTILAEAKKALAFYAERYKNDRGIQQVFLSGGSAQLQGIDTFFANNLGIETVILNPWNAISGDQIPKDLIADAPQYSVALGLAIRL